MPFGKFDTPFFKTKNQIGDRRGDTPLHAAACNGHVEIVMLLLDTAADANTTNRKGHTAAHLSKNATCLEYLFERQANLFAVDRLQRSPLFTACASGNLECARYLLDLDPTGEVRTEGFLLWHFAFFVT